MATTELAVTVRAATQDDLAAIKSIYDHEVATSIATFDLVAPPVAYWASKLAYTEPGDYMLVAEAATTAGADASTILGYAYSSAYRPRPAYSATRETSVYVAEGARGRGAGKVLYGELLSRLRADGVHAAVAVVALPNDASEGVHRACGFVRAGVLHEVGNKFGRWIDTALWECSLGSVEDGRTRARDEGR